MGAAATFDIVVASEVLEHVRRPDLFLRGCLGRVRAGGMLFVSTINDTLLSRALVVGAAEQWLGLVPRGTHDPSKFISPHRIAAIVQECGPRYTLDGVQGVAYVPWLDAWRHVPTTAVNYFAVIGKNKEKGGND